MTHHRPRGRLSRRLPLAPALWLSLLPSGCLDTQHGRIDDVADTQSAPPVGIDAGVDTASFDVSPASGFAGGWLIEQPLHALYEASHYRLHDDGSVELTLSTPAGCSGHLDRFCETGHVSPSDGSIICRFGAGRWSEPRPDALIIEAICDDGRTRAVTLDFSGQDLRGTVVPTIVSVDGEAGWRHASWDWTFRRCESTHTGSEPIRCD